MTEPFAPRSLEEALAVRAAHADAVPVAGGTDLMVAVNAGRERPAALLDLSHVDALRAWGPRDGHLFVGAGVTFARIAHELAPFRPLAEAAHSIGSPQIRNRATIGGNVVTASLAADAVPVLAAYDAEIVVASRAGERRIPWSAFFTGPKQTVLGADELVLGVEWRSVEGPGSFAKVGTRNAMVIAVASVCLQIDVAAHRVRIALGSVAPTVVRAPHAEALAAAELPWDDPRRPLPDEVVVAFGRLAAAAARPIDDVRGTAAYRRHAVEVLARRALVRAAEELGGARC